MSKNVPHELQRYIQIEGEIKILGKGVITEEDPYEEEEWGN